MALFLIAAGLIGAAGIWLLAAGAHGRSGANLDTAGMILLLHAPAIIAVRAAIGQNLLSATFANAACIGFLLGALIFSGDLALRAYTGHRLFPGASGGRNNSVDLLARRCHRRRTSPRPIN